MNRRLVLTVCFLTSVMLLRAADPEKLWQQCEAGKKPWAAYIKKYATDYSAYQALIKEIKPSLQRQQWQAAYNTALTYQKVLGDTYYYRDLLRVLSDTTVTKAPVMLSDAINRPRSSEYGPTLSVDEQSLYFVGKGRPDNIGHEDIYVSHRDKDGQWQHATIVPGLSHPATNDAPESVHGRTMYMFREGKVGISRKTAKGWSLLSPLPDHMILSSWQSDVMITADGQHLLMAAMTRRPYDKEGSVNIYVCHRQQDGTWSNPEDLGPTINTVGIDRSPYMHPDGKTLYFCSDHHGTLGGLDVFVTKRVGDKWNEWTTPRNIGRMVNTPQNECWYKITNDGRHALYAQMAQGQYNIWEQELVGDMLPSRVVTVLGHLRNDQGEVVEATIHWENLTGGSPIGVLEVDPEDGMYAVTVPVGAEYGYWIDHEDYYPLSESITVGADDTARYVWRDITLVSYEQMVQDSTPVQLNNIFFRTGSAELLPASYAELDRLAGVVKHVEEHVEILGHTDNTGTDEGNMRLSRERAEAVRRYLIDHGCSAQKITATGYGSTKPVADNNTAEGRALNRRVEFRLY